VSRTTVSADSAERLVDDGGDGLVPQPTGPLPGAFDHGVELLIGQCLEGAVDLFQARARAQQEGKDLLRQGLALGVNRELTERLLLNVRYRYEFVDYSNVVPDLTAELGPLESFNIGSFILALNYDRRDNPISPRRGDGRWRFSRPRASKAGSSVDWRKN